MQWHAPQRLGQEAPDVNVWGPVSDQDVASAGCALGWLSRLLRDREREREGEREREKERERERERSARIYLRAAPRCSDTIAARCCSGCGAPSSGRSWTPLVGRPWVRIWSQGVPGARLEWGSGQMLWWMLGGAGRGCVFRESTSVSKHLSSMQQEKYKTMHAHICTRTHIYISGHTHVREGRESESERAHARERGGRARARKSEREGERDNISPAPISHHVLPRGEERERARQ